MSNKGFTPEEVGNIKPVAYVFVTVAAVLGALAFLNIGGH